MRFGKHISSDPGLVPDGVSGVTARIRRTPHYAPLTEEMIERLPSGTFLERVRAYYAFRKLSVQLYSFGHDIIGVRNNNNGRNEVLFDLARWQVKYITKGPKQGIGRYENLSAMGGMGDVFECAKRQIVPRSRTKHWSEKHTLIENN